MGSFYTNVTVLSTDRDAVAIYLRESHRRAFVSPAAGHAIVIFDRECEEQDIQQLQKLAQGLTEHMACTALAALVHDDDVLWLALYEHGRLSATYDSSGGTPTHAWRISRALNARARVVPVWLTLAAPRLLFLLSETIRHAVLARLLHLPSHSVGFGFIYISRGEMPPDLKADDLLVVE
jgi:hypothetical protein